MRSLLRSVAVLLASSSALTACAADSTPSGEDPGEHFAQASQGISSFDCTWKYRANPGLAGLYWASVGVLTQLPLDKDSCVAEVDANANGVATQLPDVIKSVPKEWGECACADAYGDSTKPPPPAVAAPNSSTFAVSRTTSNLDVYYFGPDGALYSDYWNGNPYQRQQITAARMAPANAPIAVTSRASTNIDTFYVANDGGLWTSYWSGSGAHHTFRITGGGIAPAGAHVAAVARSSNNLDVYFVANDGSLWSAWWSSSAGWGYGAITGAGLAPAGASVAAVARGSGFLDAFVVANDGAIVTSYWASASQGYQTYRLPSAQAGSAPARAGIAAVARSYTNLDVFTVGFDGNLYDSYWGGQGWGYRQITSDYSAPAGAQVAAVTRGKLLMDAFYVGNDGATREVYWHGADWAYYAFTRTQLANAGASIAATDRTSNNMDTFVLGVDGGMYSSWWYSGTPWGTGRIP